MSDAMTFNMVVGGGVLILTQVAVVAVAVLWFVRSKKREEPE